MNKYFTIAAAGLITSATLMLAAAPAAAASVDINIGVPRVVTQPVYVQPRTVYVQPNYDQEWTERRVRATEWRNNPSNLGQAVSASAHVRNDMRKNKHKKHHGNKKHGH